MQLRLRELDDARLEQSRLQTRVLECTVLEDRISVLSGEVDRLEGVNRAQLKELDEWRYKYAEYSSHSERNADLLARLVGAYACIEAQARRLDTLSLEKDDLRRSALNSARSTIPTSSLTSQALQHSLFVSTDPS